MIISKKESNAINILRRNNRSIMKERLLFVDSMRGFAMYLVCIGHFLNHSGYANSALSGFIYSFHMPLFMAISGFVTAYTANLYENSNETILDNVKAFFQYCWKKFRSVLLPYLIWCLVAVPFFFQSYPYSVDIEKTLNRIFISYDALWFFPCLFGLLICFGVFVFLKRCIKRKYILLDILLFVVPALLVGCFYFSTHLPLFKGILSYYLPFGIGVAMGAGNYKTIVSNRSFSDISLIILILFSGYYMSAPKAFCGQFARMICGLASIPFFFYFFYNYVKSPKVTMWLSLVGKNTLIIYILHSWWLGSLWNLESWHLGIWSQIFVYPIYVTMMIIPIIAIAYIIDKNTILRFLLLGKK